MARRALDPFFLDSIPFTSSDSGVYGIVNRTDGRIYIGASMKLNTRLVKHRSDFRKGTHYSKQLQKEILDSPSSFEFVLIEQVKDWHTLQDRQQFWIDFYRSCNPEFGYNVWERGVKREHRKKEWIEKNAASICKPVIQMRLDGTIIKTFASVKEATVSLGKQPKGGCIPAAAKGKAKTAYGYKWAYVPKEIYRATAEVKQAEFLF